MSKWYMKDEKNQLSFNGGSSNNKGSWGCPCCQGGAATSTGRKKLRRLAKSRAKQEINKHIRQYI